MIPAMTDPLGKYWSQPDRSQIALDDTHALMTRSTFEMLPVYSASIPSGVYVGKMWRRHDGAYDRHCPAENRRWLLCWFGESEKADMLSLNNRIVLLDSGVPQ